MRFVIPSYATAQFRASAAPIRMTRHLLHAACPPSADRTVRPFNGWRLSVLGAGALALGMGLLSNYASAIALGPIKVQSALGEPLRAEIDVTELAASEAGSLQVRIANEAAFKKAGVPYTGALKDVRAVLQRRTSGQYVVRLSTSRAVNDPFVDLLLEANGSNGSFIRDYTLLLDPQTTRVAESAPAASPSIPSSPSSASSGRAKEKIAPMTPHGAKRTAKAPTPLAVEDTAKASPPAPSPSSAPAVVAAAPQAPAPQAASPAPAGTAAEVETAVRAWAAAWSAKDVERYLAAYAADFKPDDRKMSHKVWLAQRKQRIGNKDSISVGVDNLVVSLHGKTATATFTQNYKGGKLSETGVKTLTLKRVGAQWLILKERIGA